MRSILLAFLLLPFLTWSQRIVYSPSEKRNFELFKFEIIGKRDNSILIFHAIKNNDFTGITTIKNASIYVYDREMHFVRKNELGLPKEIYGVDFLLLDSTYYIFYQYQKGKSIFSAASEINGFGQLTGKPIILDSTAGFAFWKTNEIYSVLFSEDKNRVSVIKQQKFTEGTVRIRSLLFTNKLQLIHSSTFDIPESEGKGFIPDFKLDNSGNLVFVRISEANSPDYLASCHLVVKKADEDTVSFYSFLPLGVYIDNSKVTIDNYNKKYILTSLYSDKPRGNIIGIYNVLWSISANYPTSITKTTLSNQIIQEIATRDGSENAFNHAYIQHIRLRQNGSFIIEIEYLNGYFRLWHVSDVNRWNYLYYYQIYSWGFIHYFPYNIDRDYPWVEWKSYMGYMNYTGENILVSSFDSTGQANSFDNIKKYQSTGQYFILGYNTVNVNHAIYYIFNQVINEHPHLTSNRLNSNGGIKDDLIFKGLDDKIIFMPRYGRQISSNEMVIPCRDGKGGITFAKIEIQ